MASSAIERLAAAGVCAASLMIAGCGRPASHYAIEMAMTSAYHPMSDATLRAGGGLAMQGGSAVLAGDLHCHVSPPDHPAEASRSPAATVSLAREEGLDFVVLTPHVPARFFQDEELRAWVLASQERLRSELAGSGDGRTIFVVGMEYTDHAYGHVGASFADLRAVLADLPVDEARAHPARFFERFVAGGGLLVLNHPLSVPLDSSIAIARADLSWRPFTSADPVPEEIAAAHRLAAGVEAYNLVVTHMRDRYLLRDTPHTLLATLARTDREILAQGRRLVPVGGSDSHVDYLRATMFVRAAERSESAIRDAIVSGRTCIRSPEACSFEVRAAGGGEAGEGASPAGEWQSVGAALPAVRWLEARAAGGDLEVIVNGEAVASGEAGAVVRVPIERPGCAVVRARVGEGFSAPVYVGCELAVP